MKLYCTLSDKNFLAKGLAMYKSLKAHSGDEFKLYYLCLDEDCYKKIAQLDFPELIPVSLMDMEAEREELRTARTDRPYNEYCWTLASYFTYHLLEGQKHPEMTYLDSDLYFYSDPEIIFDEIGDRSVGITAHRHNIVGDRDGAYNVGLVYFKNSKEGMDTLRWWKDAVLKKLYPHLQTCGDQKYLEEFIPRFGEQNVGVIDGFGHAAPWNYRLYSYSKMSEGKIIWGGKEQTLVFNHFSRFTYDLVQNSMSYTSGQYRDHTMNFQVFGMPEVLKLYTDYFEVLKEIHSTWLQPQAPHIRKESLKISFGMIILDGDYVLKPCLEAIYPFAHQILVSEGPVEFWQKQGRSTSIDKTNDILNSFPDPDRKVQIVHGQFKEKDDQCRAYMQFLRDDTDYVWNLDSDEVFKPEDVETLIKAMFDNKYTSVGIKSCSFYGGFDRYIGGFEEEKDQFLRIFKVYPGSTWMSHRPPKIMHDASKAGKMLDPKHLDSDTLYDQYGVKMFHYSSVFPRQVYNKQSYYRTLAQGKFIDDYFNSVYVPWLLGTNEERLAIEQLHQGVHEYKPQHRRPSFTKPFNGVHPLVIQDELPALKAEIKKQYDEYFTQEKF